MSPRNGRATWSRRTALKALAAGAIASAPRRANAGATWERVPGAALADQYPPEAMIEERRIKGKGGPRAILDLWNGWAWDTKAEAGWLPAAGGHNGYLGNEVYRWTWGAGWERLNDPDFVNGKGVPVTENGEPLEGVRPGSTHLYGAALVLDGVPHQMVATNSGKLSQSDAGQKRLGVMAFDAASDTWTRVAKNPIKGSPPRHAALDARSRSVIHHDGKGKCGVYDPRSKAWVPVGGLIYSGQSMAVNDARRTLVILTDKTRDPPYKDAERWWFHSYALDAAGRPAAASERRVVAAKKGGPPTNVIGYDPAGEAIIALIGKAVYRFDGDETRAIEVDPLKPSKWPRNGFQNRLSYAASRDAFVVPVNDKETWLLRLGR